MPRVLTGATATMFSAQCLINVGVANVIAATMGPIKSTSVNSESIKSGSQRTFFFPGRSEGCKPMTHKIFITDLVYHVSYVHLHTDSPSSLDYWN